MEMQVFETTDLYLGAYLKAQGMNLAGVKREGRRTTFIFAERADRRELVRGFYNDGTVRVNDYKNALQDLKAAIYNV